jgi:cell division protein FtsI/penicillin-binding protein 2
MRTWSKKKQSVRTRQEGGQDTRLRIAAVVVLLIAVVIVSRLFVLMVLQHSVYAQLAQGSHELLAHLFPHRGSVYIQDVRTGETFPFAINKDVFTMYADTREITSDDVAESVVGELAEIFQYDDEKKLALFLKLNKRDDPYEPIEKKLEESVVENIKEKKLTGIHFSRVQERFYPEGNLAAQVIGFVGKDEEGKDIGRYGVEGYWQAELAGNSGFFEGIRSAKGYSIPLAGKVFEQAEDGVDMTLTIDRTIQYKACERLRAGMEEYKAASASLIIMDPKTGAMRALCSLPDFDPNTYNKVESVEVYNNTSIFTPYEPGSIFKPVTMAAAINEDLLSPNSVFHDTGSKDGICHKPIRNADLKIYKDQTMTGVLENSINTGMVYVAEQLGKKQFRHYIEQFGFGTKEGIELDSETSGTIDTLGIKKGDDIDCYAATASFGQGITATPLQMVTAFSAIANGGTLMKPYVVEEFVFPDGQVEKTKPVEIREVLTPRTAALVSGMMVNVVDSGHAGGASVAGYYVAGKTGTAQIAGRGGYTEETNHSFIGFAPVDDPKFVMIVKFEKPQRRFSASTAAPVFGDIAAFLLQYYSVPPVR